MRLVDRLYYVFIVVFGVLVFLMVFGVGSANACGDTPGFCPNPPDSQAQHHNDPPLHQYHTYHSGVKYE